MFLILIYYAFFNDYIAHCIKVFENSPRAASFWYIYRKYKIPIDAYARRNGINIKRLGKKKEKKGSGLDISVAM